MIDPTGDLRGDLGRKLEVLPDQPGAYLFKGPGGEVLYVGKAASLRHRVRSYFQQSRNLDSLKEGLVEQVHDVDYIVTSNPIDALILEAQLIKKHRPRYNIRLRDDKQYPYVRIGLGEEYPGVTLVRARADDGARYFGPYTASRALRDTLRTLRTIFPYRSCAKLRPRPRPCLNKFIGRCLAPCQGDVTPERYREMIDGLALFMAGRDAEVRQGLVGAMERAAAGLAFEQAAALRDQIKSLDAVVEGQNVYTTAAADRDVVALVAGSMGASAQVFFFRRGRLVGRDSFMLRGAAEGQEAEALAAFLTQYYPLAAEVPPEILLSAAVEDQQLLERWLTQLRGKRVRLRVPQRGEGRRLVALAAKNAQLAIAERLQRRELDPEQIRQDLVELQSALGLADYPHRIECYDVSNTGGADAVASMVVFEGGQPKKADYRRFRLRGTGPDDYAMLAEALGRRLRRCGGGDAADSFAVLPDLVIVDGGRGQAGAAAEALAAEGLAQIPVFGLAKQHELLFPPGEAEPALLPAGSGALFVVVRLRDEAHRFAVAYHRKLRTKRGLASILDEIPGVGKKRRTALLRHFGSGRAVAAADYESLAAAPGIPAGVARAIYERFREADGADEIGKTGKEGGTDDGEQERKGQGR